MRRRQVRQVEEKRYRAESRQGCEGGLREAVWLGLRRRISASLPSGRERQQMPSPSDPDIIVHSTFRGNRSKYLSILFG